MENPSHIDPLRYLRIYESTPGLSLIVRADPPIFTLVAASDDFLKLTGLKRVDIIGKGHSQLFPEKEETNWKQNIGSSFEQVIKTKTPDDIPVQRLDIPARNNAFLVKYWKIKNVPILDESGRVILIVHSIFDVTEVVLGSGVETFGIHKIHKLFMNAPVIIGYVRGENYVIDFANEGLLRVWGKTSEVIGKPLFNIFPELEQQGTRQLLDQVRKTGKPFFTYEHPLQFNRDGKPETLYFDFVYQPYYEDPDQPVASGVISVGHDVTEQIRARQLQRSLDELKNTNQNLEEFAFAASHDLKEPLRKILFFSSRLKEELKHTLDPSHLSLFERLDKSSARMQNLIDDLLEYSHAATESSDYEEVDLEVIIKNVMEDLELEIQEKGATVTWNSLPRIRANARQMHQLFQNLVSNALKYSKTDVPPKIQLSSRPATPREIIEHIILQSKNRFFFLIEINDNGIGFDQHDAEKIFKIFTRLHGKNQYTGTGIGLSIVRKVMENHNGAIWAASEPGVGSAFKLLLPSGE